MLIKKKFYAFHLVIIALFSLILFSSCGHKGDPKYIARAKILKLQQKDCSNLIKKNANIHKKNEGHEWNIQW